MQTYGSHAFRLIATLAAQGKAVSGVTAADLNDYKRARCAEVEPRSWNSEAAALKSFFDAAVLAGLRSDNPCHHPALFWYIKGAAVEPDEPDFLTLAQFERFRDEGLGWGRYGLRNVAFANMLLTSGMRLSEGNDYQRVWLPPLDVVEKAKGNSLVHKVRATSAKGHRERKVRISKRAYQSMRFYDEVLRPEIVAESDDERPLADVSAFYLSRSGSQMTVYDWTDVFDRASIRSGIKATAKTLRHTCAVYLLSSILKRTLGSIDRARDEASRVTQPTISKIYDSVFRDPLRLVQLYLGHKHYETTFIYLDALRSLDTVMDESLAIFDQVMEIEEDYASVVF